MNCKRSPAPLQIYNETVLGTRIWFFFILQSLTDLYQKASYLFENRNHVFVMFRVANHWAWVPIIACLLGGVLGAIVYIVTIELHHTLSENSDDRYYEPIQNYDTAREDQL